MKSEKKTVNKDPLELYIHIPFCEKKCSYCDFLSAPADAETKQRYVDRLIQDIRAQAGAYEDYHITSIFFGGGTPSVLKSNAIISIMSALYESWYVDAGAEVTIECNPGTVDEEKLGTYRAAGVNRISFGLQSVHDVELKRLGRIHTFEDFLKSYELAKKTGFENINIDLMSGIPRQTVKEWEDTLKEVLLLRPQHISAYSLIIEEGTPFDLMYNNEEGRKLLVDEETDREMYHLTAKLLEEKGFHRYEISNYALPGFECRHNIGYWTGAEYLGLGLGASSLVNHHRFHGENDLQTYLEMDVSRDITPLYQDVTQLTRTDEMSEFAFLGLRMTEGISGAEFMERFNANIFDVFDMAIFRHRQNGLLEVNGSRIRLTEKGLDLANVVMADFLL